MTQELKPNEYRCGACDGVFEYGWTEEEAKEEAKQWGDLKPEDMAVVCDDCYKKMMGQE